MFRPGKRNLITDVAGLTVGHAQDAAARTGVTVLMTDRRYPCAADMRGGAPGNTNVEALDPVNLVDGIDAIALSGGSAFGLDAVSGVMAHLRAQGRGFEIAPGAPKVPIAAGAILFDLANGGDKDWGEAPFYRALAIAACESAAGDFALGNAGAGLGAVAGAYKGGTGSASAVTDDGFTVGALAVVNAVGSPLIPGTDVFWAFALERGGEFGGRRLKGPLPEIDSEIPRDAKGARANANTTIAIVATDADLTRVELKRLAIMAADGFARSLRPVHAPFDGDTVFALSTGRKPIAEFRALEVTRLGSLAADTIARAIARGVYEAETLGNVKSYREIFANGE